MKILKNIGLILELIWNWSRIQFKFITLKCYCNIILYVVGFILSDMGYDVWLGSMRGNHGTSNIEYNTSQPQFWDFR